MVEPWIVYPVVAGSSPVVFATYFKKAIYDATRKA